MGETVEEYQAYSKPEKFKAKDTRYFTPCTFTAPKRNLDNADKIQFIVLDIDGGDFAQEFSAADLADLETFDQFPFNWVVHTTTGHTPENPRYRVIVDADGHMDGIHYRDCVMTVADLIGLEIENITTESKVVCQAMFIPKLPKDAEYHFESRTDGRPFELDDINHSLAGTHSFNSTPKRVAATDEDFIDMLVPTSDEEDDVIVSALDSIDPNCSRPDWINICCGLKHQFYDDLERGYDIFDNWSAQADPDKYLGPEDTRRQWDYEEANPSKRPVTIKTLFKMATDAGWTKSAMAPPVDLDSHGISFEGLTVREILEKCPEIKKLDTNPVTRTQILKAMQARLKALDHACNLADLRTMTKPVIKKKAYKWLKPWIYVEKGAYYAHKTDSERELPVKDFNLAFNYKVPIDADGKQQIAHDVAIVRVPSVIDVVYEPTECWGIQTIKGRQVFNRYRRHTLKPSKENIGDAKRLLIQLVKGTTDDPIERQMIWDYLAHLIQYPHRRIAWGLLLQGVPGSGKTMIYELLNALNGEDNTTFVSGETLLEPYTRYLGRQTILFVDEVYAPGKQKYALNGKLKMVIGNKKVIRRAMRRDATPVPNHASVIMTTNYRDALPLDKDDRRVAMAFSPITVECMQAPAMQAFYAEFNTRLEELAPAYLHLLLTRRISDSFNPNGHAPTTISKRAMLTMTKSHSVEICEQLIVQGNVPGVSRNVISTKALYDVLAERYPDISRGAMRKALIDMGYAQSESRWFHNSSRSQHPIWLRHGFRKDIPQAIKLCMENYGASPYDAEFDDADDFEF